MNSPAIESAYDHALRNETRELIAVDIVWEMKPCYADFAAASRRVGQCQLQKLRPLRDQRLVPAGTWLPSKRGACSWMAYLVYGITLAIYSMPLRQGLLG
jgi:hypothetical protein